MEEIQKPILFQTIGKHNVVIVKQPFRVKEKYKTGGKAGQTKSIRMAQYCDTLESIYIEEQKKIEKNPRVTPIYIRKGKLLVDPDETPLLIEAMRNHEDNVANGGKLFREVDANKDEIEAIKLYQELDKIRSYIMSSKPHEAKTMGLFYLGHSTLNISAEKIKLKLREKVEQNIDFRKQLIEFSELKNKKEKLIATIALIEQEIYLEGKVVYWTKDKEKIYIAPQQSDAINSFADWLILDKEGREVYASLLDSLDKHLEKN